MLQKIVWVSVVLLAMGCRVRDYASDSLPVSHQLWNDLLEKHVDKDGWVNYSGFIRDSAKLDEYLELLASHHPNRSHWSSEERMAYWINAYNAFTVKLITQHYPVGGIKKIKGGIPFVNSVWDIKFIEIEGQTYDLNNLEHGILRKKFKDPRIHFALNCASVSCPRLQGFAFTADSLDAQLDEAGRQFLREALRNRIQSDRLDISPIFKWYKGDFISRDQSLIDFLNLFAPVEISPDAEIEYRDYDWRLNQQGVMDVTDG
jgi:hypothetical protein